MTGKGSGSLVGLARLGGGRVGSPRGLPGDRWGVDRALAAEEGVTPFRGSAFFPGDSYRGVGSCGVASSGRCRVRSRRSTRRRVPVWEGSEPEYWREV